MSNSLAAVHPELVAEWSEKNLPLTPDSITFGSNKKVWWKGACGHEWQTSVKARSNGEKCPIVSFLANGIMKRINGSRQKYHEILQRERGGSAGTVIHGV